MAAEVVEGRARLRGRGEPGQHREGVPVLGMDGGPIGRVAERPHRRIPERRPEGRCDRRDPRRPAGALARLTDPDRQLGSKAKRPHVARVVVGNGRPLARDICVVEGTELVDEQPAGSQLGRVPRVHQLHEVRPDLTSECEVAGVQDVVVDVIDPVGVVVEEGERAVLVRAGRDRAVVVLRPRVPDDHVPQHRRVRRRRHEQRQAADRLIADIGAAVADKPVEQHLRKGDRARPPVGIGRQRPGRDHVRRGLHRRGPDLPEQRVARRERSGCPGRGRSRKRH